MCYHYNDSVITSHITGAVIVNAKTLALRCERKLLPVPTVTAAFGYNTGSLGEIKNGACLTHLKYFVFHIWSEMCVCGCVCETGGSNHAQHGSLAHQMAARRAS